ncbi:hypothetical protein C7271_14570 [filamentous cyanobacterium CCP5]|nr:hypothetical protein C7271_14570 [filamentous cyanobacterium CCP5]
MRVPYHSGSEETEDFRWHLRDLAYGDFQERWEALKRLSVHGVAVVEPLLNMLQDDQLDWEARWFAARGLAAFDRPETVEALLRILAHGQEEELREAAGEALSQIGPSAVMALSSQLHRLDQKKIAGTALTRIHHPAAIAPLLQLVEDEDADIRQQVMASLGTYRQPDATHALLKALADRSASVKIEAIKALAVRHDLAPGYGLSDRLQRCLDDENAQVVTAAIGALSRFATASVIERLATIMEDGARPEATRAAAARSLGWMGTSAAFGALAAARVDGGSKLQAEIIAALASPPPALERMAVTALLERLPQLQAQPHSESVLQDLALALGRLGDRRALSALEALSTHDHEGVRLHSQAALRQLVVS